MEQPLSPKSVSTRDAKDVVIRELLKKVAVLESQTYYDDEQSVQDKTSSFFHQPHVLSAIFAVLGYLLYQTWTASPETSFEINLKNGIFAAAFFFWILGMMTFPTSGMLLLDFTCISAYHLYVISLITYHFFLSTLFYNFLFYSRSIFQTFTYFMA